MSESRAGWYPDPSGDQSKLRYWDGEKWTDNYAASPSAAQGSCEPNAGTGDYVPPSPQPAAYQTTTRVTGMSSEDSTLRLIAFIFCIISTVSTCWLILPLAWMIPMTVVCWGIYKGTRPNTTAFGVCTLLFVTLVGGILLLISKKDQ